MDLPLALANDIGLIAFSISGVYKGINKKLDILGIATLGFLTALGGGVIRDILANKVPHVFLSYSDIKFALLGVIIGLISYIFTKKDVSNLIAIKISDAIGLAAFTVIGSNIGMSKEFNIIGVVLLGVVTGVGGGLTSDLLTLKIPMVLSEDFYASCSIIGGLVYYLLDKSDIGNNLSIYLAFAAVLALRLPAIIFKWHLPKFN